MKHCSWAAIIVLLMHCISLEAGEVTAVRKGDVVQFLRGSAPLLAYQGEQSALPAGYDVSFRRGGYTHPVHTPSGVVVTDDYPVKHKHHHGSWSPWTKTEFEGRAPDFWNMGQKK